MIFNENFSSNLVFLRENRFREDQVNIWPLELILNFKNTLFLWARYYFYLQDIKISFEDVDFFAKLSQILDTLVSNSTIQLTKMGVIKIFRWYILVYESFFSCRIKSAAALITAFLLLLLRLLLWNLRWNL